ncbi:MAG: hypothetical protein ACLGI9_25060 [Thermoanaerobaculia bacterium]
MNKNAGQPEASGPGPFPWFLPSLVELSQQTGLRPVVTLSVGGLLISGELIDGKSYFEELIRETRATPAGAVDEAIRTRLLELYQSFADRYGRPGLGSEQSAHAEPAHLHFRTARVYHPSGAPIPSGGGLMWRVRLDAVEGFTLGLPPKETV